MCDRLPLKGMCLGSHDLHKIWELSDKILETVQDRDLSG